MESNGKSNMTYLFLGVFHRLPATGAFVGNFLWTRVRTQVTSNWATVVLHEEEVGGQGTLGRIGVNRGALALLRTTGLGLGTGATSAHGRLKAHEARGAHREFNNSITSLGDGLHMLDISSTQVGDIGLDLQETREDLEYIVSTGFPIWDMLWQMIMASGRVRQHDTTV